MKKLHLLGLALAASVGFFSCQKEKTPTPPPLEEAHYFTPDFSDFEVTDRSGWTTLDAGSVDQLEAAIAATDPGGVIYFRAGLHIENSKITISKSVKIIGETGAILKIKSTISAYTSNNEFPVLPALHVLNASSVLIQNLKIEPIGGDGSTAILIENSPECGVLQCKINRFQCAVTVEKSDRVAIMHNEIDGSTAWLTQLLESDGITIMNGKSAYLSDNDIKNTFFGVWACDKWGTIKRNIVHENLCGIVLCKVPQYFMLPSGSVVGAESSATNWKASENRCKSNFDNGIMVIDGSSGNRIWDNEVTGNGGSPLGGVATDIEVFDGSMLFGFFTPATHDNWIDATKYQGSTIKNCSAGNTIIGGVLSSAACR